MRASSHAVGRAKALRGRLSPPEVLLWARLRGRAPGGPVFRRQHPIGPYIADFFCAAARLVVEVDGIVHAEEGQREHDERRDAYLEEQGYRVLRCRTGDVMADPDAVAQSIVEAALAYSR